MKKTFTHILFIIILFSVSNAFCFGKSVENGNKLANLLEKAPFKDDIYKLRAFLDDIEKSTDLQDFVKTGKDFTKEWDIVNKAGKTSLIRSKELLNLAKIIEKAPFKDDVNKLKAFLYDIEKNTNLIEKFTSNPKLLDAFDFLFARGQMRADEAILESTAKLLKNNSKYVSENLEKIQRIYEKLADAGARCRTCKSPGNNKGIKYIDEIIDDLDFAITHYGNKPENNFGKLLTEMASLGNKADGGAFMLQYLKEQGAGFASKVKEFENFYLDGANFEADIKMLDGTLKEFKSYAKNSWESFGGTSSLNQLKGYIKSGQPFEYIANKTKLINDGVADPNTFVKEQFQRVFKKDNYALFEEFMNNPIWKDKLFKNLSETQAKSAFKNFVDNFDSRIYNVIVE